MDTSLTEDRYIEEAFLAGIASEICKKEHSIRLQHTTELISVKETGSSYFDTDDSILRNKLRLFLSQLPRHTHQTRAMRSLYIDEDFEKYLESLSYASYEPDVLKFCIRQGLYQYLAVGIELVGKHFSMIQELNVHQEQNPETGDQWIVLDVTVKGEVERVLDEYDRYTDDWILSVPWPKREKIRLSYNII